MLLSQRELIRRQWSEDESFRYCEALAAGHYENFPVASALLPSAKRKHVAAIYAFARIADDAADEPGLTPAERMERLSDWESQLEACYRGEASHPVFAALRATADKYDIPVDLFRLLLAAFKSDVTTHRYASFQDVLAYCSNSANPVGRLVLLLFGYRDHQLMNSSDRICTALQLANFWQDVSVDLDKDRVYLPLEDLRRFNLSEEQLFTRRCTPEFRKLLEFQVGRTEEFFHEGKPLLKAVGRDLAFELRLTWHGGMRILRKIRRAGYDVFRSRPTLSWVDKTGLLIRGFIG